jgi:hypothetical protein
MPHEKESAPGVEVGRASANEGNRIIPHDEWERGMRLLPVPFAAMLAIYAIMMACGVGS